MQILTISSPSFPDGALIPVIHTGYGADQSPELVLHGLCEEAVSLAVILNDMDHPIPAYNHWVIWNLPVMSIIPGNIPRGAQVPSLSGAIQGIGYGRQAAVPLVAYLSIYRICSGYCPDTAAYCEKEASAGSNGTTYPAAGCVKGTLPLS